MTIQVCDLCGTRIPAAAKRRLSGGLAMISGAEDICPECYRIVINSDWRSLARDYISAQRRKAAKK